LKYFEKLSLGYSRIIWKNKIMINLEDERLIELDACLVQCQRLISVVFFSTILFEVIQFIVAKFFHSKIKLSVHAF
jgi:hypothetical protein